MATEQHPKLETIWPRVQREIERARRREKAKHQALRLAAPLGIGLVLAGLSWLSLQYIDQQSQIRPQPQASWRIGNISPATEIAVDYPLNHGNRIFAVYGKGTAQQVVCLDRWTGEMLWTSAFRFSQCRLAVQGGRIYVLALTNQIHWACLALNAANGQILWSRITEAAVALPRSTLAVAEGGLCWREGRQVVVLEPTTGALRWRKSIAAGQPLSIPIAHDNHIFIAGGERLQAFAAATGELQWSLPLPSASPLASLNRPWLKIGDGRLFYTIRTLSGGRLWCFDLAKHEMLWNQSIDAPIRLDYHNGRLYVRSQDLCAYDAATGHALWRIPAGGCGTLHFRGQQVYLVDAANQARILALDSATGKTLWTRSAPASCNGIVISGKLGLLSGNNRTLYAFVLDKPS